MAVDNLVARSLAHAKMNLQTNLPKEIKLAIDEAIRAIQFHHMPQQMGGYIRFEPG